MKILAKDYNQRQDLEKFVAGKFGLTPILKPDHTIEGTRAELQRLHLNDTNLFWGIKCFINVPEEVTPKKPEATKADRGEKTDFGINKRDKKIKKK